MKTICIIMATVMAVGLVHAQDCRDYHQYPHWSAAIELPENPGALVVHGDLAYVSAADQNLLVVDISRPATPTPGFTLGGTGSVQDLVVHQDHLWIAADHEGIRGATLQYPQYPILTSHLDFPGYVTGLDCEYDRLYLANGFYGVHILDISNPNLPFLLGTLDTDGTATKVAAKGHLLYVAAGSAGLLTIDVSDPTVPVQIHHVPTDGSFDDIVLHEGSAYVTDEAGILYRFSLSQPEAPEQAEVEGMYSPAGGMAIAGDDLIVGLEDQTRTYSLDALNLTGTLLTRGQTGDVATHRDRILVMGQDSGFQELVNPEAEACTPWTSQTLDRTCHDILIQDDLGFVANGGDGLSILDMSDAFDVRLLGRIEGDGWALSVDREGDLAVVGGMANGIWVVDVSDPTSPLLVGQLALPGTCTKVEIRDGKAWLGLFDGGFAVVDLSDPTEPAILDILEPERTIHGFTLVGNRAYLAHSFGLKVVDITNPHQLLEITTILTDDWVGGVTVQGGLAYLGVWNSGLHILDISDPLDPQTLARMPLPRQVGKIVLKDDVLHVLSQPWGVFMVDVSDPLMPRMIGGALAGENTYDLEFQGGWTWVTRTNQIQAWPSQCGALSAAPEVAPISWRDPYLLQAHPNPFNPRTEIRFTLTDEEPVRVDLFDLRGRFMACLAEEVFAPGEHRVAWDGKDSSGRAMPSGTFMARVQGASGSSLVKLTLLR